MPTLASPATKSNQGAALKTGTDDMPLTETGGAYKKLTKKPYFDSNKMSLSGTGKGTETSQNGNMLSKHSVNPYPRCFFRLGCGVFGESLYQGDREKYLSPAVNGGFGDRACLVPEFGLHESNWLPGSRCRENASVRQKFQKEPAYSCNAVANPVAVALRRLPGFAMPGCAK